MIVEVLDSIMGSGKTTAIFKYMDERPNQKWMYITPLKSESDVRAVSSTGCIEMFAPSTEDHKTKGAHLLELLREGKNISMTHALHKEMGKEHFDLVKLHEYNIVIDECPELIMPLSEDYSKSDFVYVKTQGHLVVSEDDGKLSWTDETTPYDSKYGSLRRMCESESLFCAKRSEEMVVVQLPTTLLACAKRTILLTYLFDGSVLDAFFKLKNISTVPFTEVELQSVDKKNISKLITFIGEKKKKPWQNIKLTSSHWQSSNFSPELCKKLSNTIRQIGLEVGATSNDLLWCVPSPYSGRAKKTVKTISPKGYAVGSGEISEETLLADGCFLPCSAIATNAYRNRNTMIHAFDRYPHQVVLAYLQDHGQSIDADRFALSELLQWLWRSRIRNNEPINLCLLSPRMNDIFTQWLND